MSVLIQEDHWGHDTHPPRYLYKYLCADRVSDVLEAGMVRFSHLLSTNDSFEVRKTFQQFAGPQFVAMLSNYMEKFLTEEKVDEVFAEKIKESGFLSNVCMSEVKAQILTQSGMSIKDLLKIQMQPFIKLAVTELNKSKSPEDLLCELGSKLLCFSLSEAYNIPPMWAHYAGNHTGFVIEFDTEHMWFRRSDDQAKSRLQKVVYLDEVLEEPFINPQAAFISKTTDWKHEREWRLNCGVDKIEKVLGSEIDPIHLVSFPKETVSSIIVGQKATESTIDRLRSVVKRLYPAAVLLMAIPNRTSREYDLMEL